MVGYLSLDNNWRRNVLYRMEREGKKLGRRKATTEKIPIAPGLLKVSKLNFQRKIKTKIEKQDIPDDLIIKFDQTPLTCVCSPNHTLHVKGGKVFLSSAKESLNKSLELFPVPNLAFFCPCNSYIRAKRIDAILKVLNSQMDST